MSIFIDPAFGSQFAVLNSSLNLSDSLPSAEAVAGDTSTPSPTVQIVGAPDGVTSSPTVQIVGAPDGVASSSLGTNDAVAPSVNDALIVDVGNTPPAVISQSVTAHEVRAGSSDQIAPAAGHARSGLGITIDVSTLDLTTGPVTTTTTGCIVAASRSADDFDLAAGDNYTSSSPVAPSPSHAVPTAAGVCSIGEILNAAKASAMSAEIADVEVVTPDAAAAADAAISKPYAALVANARRNLGDAGSQLSDDQIVTLLRGATAHPGRGGQRKVPSQNALVPTMPEMVAYRDGRSIEQIEADGLKSIRRDGGILGPLGLFRKMAIGCGACEEVANRIAIEFDAHEGRRVYEIRVAMCAVLNFERCERAVAAGIYPQQVEYLRVSKPSKKEAK